MVKHMFLQYNCPCHGQHLGQKSKHLTQGIPGQMDTRGKSQCHCAVYSENHCYWQSPTRSDPTPWLTHPSPLTGSTFTGPFPPSAPPLSIFLSQCLMWSFSRSWNDWVLPFCQAFSAEGNFLEWSSGQLYLKNHPPKVLSVKSSMCFPHYMSQGRARAI